MGKIIKGLLGILVVFAVGFGTYQYLNYRNQTIGADLHDLASHVEIIPPEIDEPYTVGDAVLVETKAFGPAPIVSMELWIDGILAGVQAAPSPGLNPFATHFVWFPDYPGIYSLVARSQDSEEHTSTSLTVEFLINPSDEEDEGKEDDGISGGGVLPSYGSGYSPPNVPENKGGIGPASIWNGSPGAWLTNLTVNLTPAPPELAAAPDGCTINLWIHDLSSNEEGFKIYRKIENSLNWELLALLNAQSEFEWLSFSDSGISGKVNYYVSAFNAHGEGESNLAMVAIDPSSCPPSAPSSNFPVLSIELLNLKSDMMVDLAYCYRSIGGSKWGRWPQSGFFMPGEDGFNIQGQHEEFMLTDLEGNSLIEKFDLKLECWGWSGDMLEYLGRITFEDLGSDNEGSFQILGDGLSAEIVLGFINLFDPDILYANKYDWPIGELDFLLPVSPIMPYIEAEITFNPEDCRNHLPPDSQHPIGYLVGCFAFPGYSVGGANPQPYLIWTVSDNCWQRVMDTLSGDGNSNPCLPVDSMIASADINNAQMGYIFTDVYRHTSVQTISNPEMTTRQIPPCDQAGYHTRELSVQMFYIIPGEGAFKGLSPPSNIVKFMCPPGMNQVKLAVTFQSLKLWNVDDDDNSSIQDVEVYGGFYARPVNSKQNRSAQLNEFWDPDCGLEDIQWIGSLPQGGGFGCEQVMRDGLFNLADIPLCHSGNSSPNHSNCVDLTTNNNTLEVIVEGDDELRLGVVMIDEDTSSGDDTVCIYDNYYIAFSYQQWATIKDYPFTMMSDNENASCEVHGVINAVLP